MLPVATLGVVVYFEVLEEKKGEGEGAEKIQC